MSGLYSWRAGCGKRFVDVRALIVHRDRCCGPLARDPYPLVELAPPVRGLR